MKSFKEFLNEKNESFRDSAKGLSKFGVDTDYSKKIADALDKAYGWGSPSGLIEILGMKNGIIHVSGSITGSLAMERRSVKVYMNLNEDGNRADLISFTKSDGFGNTPGVASVKTGGWSDSERKDVEIPYDLKSKIKTKEVDFERRKDAIIFAYFHPDWYRENKVQIID